MQLLETVKLDSGLYTLAQAALFARMPLATLNYWHYGTKQGKPLRDSEIPKSEGKFLTFMEFIEALAIRSLRKHEGISLHKIREAIAEAQNKYQIGHPFAQQTHKTIIIGKEIHILLDNDATTGLTGKDKAQKSFNPCLEPFMEDLKFDETKMAYEYVAYRYGEGDDKIIRMNPKLGFGEPLVGRTGYPAETLWKAAVSEGSIDKASEYYEVDRVSVAAACRYWDGLSAAA